MITPEDDADADKPSGAAEGSGEDGKKASDAASCSAEIPKNGIIPPPYDEKLTEKQKEALRSIKPVDNALVDRHKEGYWRGSV
jgi:hypothetical protein